MGGQQDAQASAQTRPGSAEPLPLSLGPVLSCDSGGTVIAVLVAFCGYITISVQSAFVNELAGWGRCVCPFVSGLQSGQNLTASSQIGLCAFSF